MKASVFHNHGGPDVLSYETVEDPTLSSTQVLIEVKGVALNHLDLFVRKGWPGLNLTMPHILGSDVAGVVKDTGDGVKSTLTPGDRVVVDPSVYCGHCEFCLRGEHSLCDEYRIIGEHVRGGYADYIAVEAENVIPVPNDFKLDLTMLAAMPLTTMTAWRALVTKARLRAGQDILIVGIGGGLAVAALQIAGALGARAIVTSSSDEKLKRAVELGAAQTINHREQPDYHKEVWRLTNRRGVDVVLDSVGQATWERSLRSLRKGGRLIVPGATSGPNATTNVSLVFWKQLEILGTTMGSRSELRDALRLVWSGRVRPVVDRVMPLSKAREAHEVLERGEQFGKIIMTP
ncbi:MAG: zinc-binding dehydrogenase [Candidatus Thorarchaeota archaeon]|nr:zinc-binding dehydrogenase [Candidatus Thorarchaeota archaeon]